MNKIKQARSYLKKHIPLACDTCIVLGSGWDIIDRDFYIHKKIPYKKIPNFPSTSVAGHKGELIIANLKSVHVAVLSGRIHLYEGYRPQDVIFPLRVLKGLGVKKLIVTNAAGAINPKFKVGNIMLIKDHIDLMWSNPLRGKNDDSLGNRFPDMYNIYSPELIKKCEIAAKKNRIKLRRGVYLGVTGPSFETASEIRMFSKIGADAVGMSTVPEVIASAHMGIKVLGVSLLVNKATGLSKNILDHKDVLKVARRLKPRLKTLIKDIILGD